MKFILPVLFLIASTWAQTEDINTLKEMYGDIITELWAKNGSQTTTTARTPGAATWIERDQNSCICVQYYNCDPDTNRIIVDPKTDGFGVIDIRFGTQGQDQTKCPHYLEKCCLPAENPSVPIEPSTESTGSVTGPPVTVPTKPPPTQPPPPLEVKCGIRNLKGVGFQIKGNENHEAEYAEFPWMVALLRTDYNYADDNVDKNLALCGASLIHKQVVLTGAHCVNKLAPNQLKIRAGEWDTQTGKEQYPYQERPVTQILMHEGFHPKSVINDIALLVLQNPVEYAPNVKPVCLPRQGQEFLQRNCYVSGWGKKSFGKLGQLSVILKKIELPMVNRRTCEANLRKTRLGTNFILDESFVCAGGEEGKDACTGDGGGPLVCPDTPNSLRYEQAGIVAWGIGCGQANVPGVYANVARYRNWIDSHMKRLGYGTESYTV